MGGGWKDWNGETESHLNALTGFDTGLLIWPQEMPRGHRGNLLELLKLMCAWAAILFLQSLWARRGFSSGPCSRSTSRIDKATAGRCQPVHWLQWSALVYHTSFSLLYVLLLVIWALFFICFYFSFHFAFCFRNCIILTGIEKILLLYYAPWCAGVACQWNKEWYLTFL